MDIMGVDADVREALSETCRSSSLQARLRPCVLHLESPATF